MSETFQYIERYFTGDLTPHEREVFENRCRADAAFADEVAFYIAARKSIKAELYEKKKIEFEEATSIEPPVIPFRQRTTFKIALAIAASVLLVVITYFIYSATTPGPQQLAKNYIDKNLVEISQAMNPSQDSLQQGIAAYNHKDYTKALGLFRELYKNNAANRDAKEYTGYVYLVTKEYDNALQQFEELVKMDGDFNRGMFLKAVTLLQRNTPGDREQAKQLLQEVVNEKAAGSEEAREWLSKF